MWVLAKIILKLTFWFSCWGKKEFIWSCLFWRYFWYEICVRIDLSFNFLYVFYTLRQRSMWAELFIFCCADASKDSINKDVISFWWRAVVHAAVHGWVCLVHLFLWSKGPIAENGGDSTGFLLPMNYQSDNWNWSYGVKAVEARDFDNWLFRQGLRQILRHFKVKL